MIKQLSLDEVLELCKTSPEQAVFDWKSDFTLPKDHEKQGELIKDITAIANAISSSPGFILYGVDPRRDDPIVGIQECYDDAKLQQLLKDKVKPAIEFIYYEVVAKSKVISVIHVNSTRKRPHIISTDIGKVRNGQIPIRRGSSTDGADLNDLKEMFYGETSGYFQEVLEYKNLRIRMHQAETERLTELREERKAQQNRLRQMIGLPLEK